ncbi:MULTISPECIES: LysR family transcriptional regulator [Bacillaceae]|uniref:LysR family transcriptional regulator n=1 Tax=Bacillaceae TaxID=186817 RepID=UPI001C570618|nr:LysR family transcriptional regulator [Rossellomorea sp. YZS02]MBW3114657.1 LysR family transcriptional regulator [Bacillus sp. MCCB 382]MDX8343498.1 LysR family transcriptional regulator [Rossellomorea sp. YZS02]
MDLNVVKTFISAAEFSHFRKAAERLYISQPTVTVHIKQLEKKLGVKLFEREGKKIKLTEAGRSYLKHAKRLIEIYEEGITALQSISQGYTKTLKMAISPLIADNVLPFVLKQFLENHPQVEISVEIIESDEIEKAVLEERVDIGLSCLPCFSPELEQTLLFTDKVIMVAPHDGRDFESAPPLEEEELLASNYLLTHNHPAYWDDLCYTIKQFYPKTRMMKVSQTHITKRFITEGLGISYLPASTVRRELLEGRLLEVETKSFPMPVAKTYAILKYQHGVQKELLRFLSRFRL